MPRAGNDHQFRRAGRQPRLSITSVKWVGLRCRVQASARRLGCSPIFGRASRTRAPRWSAKPKEIEPDGQTSLLVSDDRKAGTKATVVLVDASDNVVAKFPTVIGKSNFHGT